MPLAKLSVLRGCLQSEGSSSFWIILASFRLPQFGGQYTALDIAPQMGIENRLKRTEKSTELHIVDTLLVREPILALPSAVFPRAGRGGVQDFPIRKRP